MELAAPRKAAPSPAILDFAAAVERALNSADGVVAIQEIANRLSALLPVHNLLTPEQRAGDSTTYTQHILYVHPEDLFSILSLVFRPGQRTPPHDHRVWCVTGVYEGEERETLFAAGENDLAVPVSSSVRQTGDVTMCLPDTGDIHQVENSASIAAISLHVYGGNTVKLGTSIRRCYRIRRTRTCKPAGGRASRFR